MKTKDELLKIIAGVSTYSYDRLRELGCHLCEYEICGESDFFAVEVEEVRGSEGDGADMFLTFKITDKETNAVGYLEYSGRYSSWDSSMYDERYVVRPEEVTIIQYNRVE